MFKKRKYKAAIPQFEFPQTPPPNLKSPLALPTPPITPKTPTTPIPDAPPSLDRLLLSDVELSFHFDLSSPNIRNDVLRPQTSDGIGPRSSNVSKPPVPTLPPVDVVGQRGEPSSGARRFQEAAATMAELHNKRPTTSAGDNGAYESEPTSSTYPMASSLFPNRAVADTVLPIQANDDSIMNRAWLDARDKPYTPPSARSQPQRPLLQTASSTPNLRKAAQEADSLPSASTTRSAIPASPTQRPFPIQSRSTSNMLGLARPPSNAATNYSGTTLRSSSKSTNAGLDMPTKTIGFSYSESSASFPLPQLVATRPKTAGAMATIRGVDVPTHHTSALKSKSEPTPKAEKRKTKLLNPMNLLTRRRSGNDDEATLAERTAQAQALQRQRNVAAVGVNGMPENFDPSIRGKVVHDFSAPRHSRQISYGNVPPAEEPSGLQTSNSAPLISTPPDNSDTRHRHLSEGSPRRSLHTPLFKEHLDEDQANIDTAAVQAERLENRAFLDRASQISHGSVALPPFARRSQTIDAAQATQADDQSTAADRIVTASNQVHDRNSSGSNGISPVTQRGSGLTAAIDSARQSVSPISPASANKLSAGPIFGPSSRPVSDASNVEGADFAGRQRMSEISKAASLDVARPQSNISSTSDSAQQLSGGPLSLQLPVLSAFSPIMEEQSSTPGYESASPSEALPAALPVSPQVELDSLDLPVKADSAVSSISAQSPPHTPELGSTDPSATSKGTSRSAKKRTKRMPSNKTPKKVVSNASRFSFQFGGNTTEETELEDKARRLTALSGAEAKPAADDEEDDYFDEDAMFDRDEMEAEAEQEQHADDNGNSMSGQMNARKANSGDADMPIFMPDFMPTNQSGNLPAFIPMADLRQKLQLRDDDSDGVTDDGSDAEQPYWRHSAFDSYTHTRTASDVDRNSVSATHQRRVSEEMKLKLNTNIGLNGMMYNNVAPNGNAINSNIAPNGNAITSSIAPNGNAFLQNSLLMGDSARSNFYMQPKAAGYPQDTMRPAIQPERSSARHRNSESSGHNRAASGLSMTAASNIARQAVHQASHSSSSAGSGAFKYNRSSNGSNAAGLSTADTSGLGLSGFSGFKFHDSPAGSRPLSTESMQRYRPSGADRSRGDSETLPQNATFAAGRAPLGSSPARKQHDLDDLDLYFDDGGFETDVNNRSSLGQPMDESAFDYMERPTPQAGGAGISLAGLVPDGPYPAFARTSVLTAKVRESELLLEDLPLYENTYDPKWIPRRNPSEDARRLGLHSRAPPLAPEPGTDGSAASISANLEAYHAALAKAANKAAADGRFFRNPSVSTTQGVAEDADDVVAVPELTDVIGKRQVPEVEGHGSLAGAVSSVATDDQLTGLNDTGDQSERSMPGVNEEFDNEDETIGPLRTSQAMQGLPQLNTKRMSNRLSFDFGFDSAPMDDSLDDYDPTDDDDYIAAANAEALANDEEGFYGQEFGFYAKARPNSQEVEAINGGFFGLVGDDGLNRQKSLREPNLTPITERSEFSTRNSFIGLGYASAFSPYPPSSGRMSSSPWIENEVTTFDQLRKLKAHAFSGSNVSNHSLGSDSSGQGMQMSLGSAPVSAGSANGNQGSFGGTPMAFGYSTDSSGSSDPSSAYPQSALQAHDSPQSAEATGYVPFATSSDATPKRASASTAVDSPVTARKISDKLNRGHSRNSSGADSVTYVREQDPDGNGPPRWVLEKRRTSEAGQLELVARELVPDAWI